MALHLIKKGLDLPLSGATEQKVYDGASVSYVALVAEDYPFMKPRMFVAVGDQVKRGQLLMEDRKAEGVRFTAPAAGEVVAINRGARRALQTVVIRLSEGELQGEPPREEFQPFESYTDKALEELGVQEIKDLLQESGLWTAIRQRPFNTVPSPAGSCKALFINAMSSEALSGDPEVIIAGQEEEFAQGMKLVSQLTEGSIYLCRKAGSKISFKGERVRVEEFSGKHPAGLVGTHIHTLDPVHTGKVVWHLGYQDVIAIGQLFQSGRLPVERIIALSGPMVKEPRLLRTRLGAEIAPLIEGQLKEGEPRVIAGSILYGRKAMTEVHGYLGRYLHQISCLVEDRKRRFMGWLMPGGKMFSTARISLAALLPKKLAMGTSTFGSHRAMVPIGMFERVMPLDIMPTFLLRALAAKDLERAEALGCLELDEEDLALCTFVSPGKQDWGAILRENLFQIWKEG